MKKFLSIFISFIMLFNLTAEIFAQTSTSAKINLNSGYDPKTGKYVSPQQQQFQRNAQQRLAQAERDMAKMQNEISAYMNTQNTNGGVVGTNTMTASNIGLNGLNQDNNSKPWEDLTEDRLMRSVPQDELAKAQKLGANFKNFKKDLADEPDVDLEAAWKEYVKSLAKYYDDYIILTKKLAEKKSSNTYIHILNKIDNTLKYKEKNEGKVSYEDQEYDANAFLHAAVHNLVYRVKSGYTENAGWAWSKDEEQEFTLEQKIKSMPYIYRAVENSGYYPEDKNAIWYFAYNIVTHGKDYFDSEINVADFLSVNNQGKDRSDNEKADKNNQANAVSMAIAILPMVSTYENEEITVNAIYQLMKDVLGTFSNYSYAPVAILTGARALIAFDSDYSLGKLYTFLTEDCKKGFLKGAYDFAMSIFSAEEWAKKITRITDIFTSEKKTGGNAYNSNLSLAFTYMDKGKTGYEQTSMAEGALTEEYYNANYTNIFEEIGRELGKMAFSARAQKYATLFANRLLNKGFNANAASDDLSASIVVGILEFGMMGETSLKSAAEMIYNGSWWDLNEATQRDKNNIAAKYLGKPQKGFNKEKREKFEKMLNAHNTGKYLDIGINAIMISTMIASAPKILVAIDDFLDYIAFKIKMVGKTKVLKTIPNIKPAPEITPAKTATTGNLSAKPVPEITPAKTAVAGNLSAKPVPEITPAKTATTDLTVKAGEITAGKNTSLTTAKELNSNSLAQGSMGLMNKTSAGSKLVDILMPQWLTKTFTNRNIAKTPNSVVPLNSKPLPNEISATKGIPATNKPQKSFFEEEIIRLNKRMGYSDHPIIISLTQHKEEDLIRLIDDFLQGYGFASYVRIYPYGQYTHVLITDNVREHALNAISERIAKISEGKNLTAVQKKALEEILGETTSFLKETKDCLACELGDKIQKFYLKTDEIVNNKEPEKNSFVEEITRLNQTRDIKIVSHDLHTEQELIETIDNLFLGSKNLMSFSYNTQILITDKVREHILNTISEKIAKITAEKELTAVEKRTLDEISREVKYFATARKDYHIIDLQDKIRKFYSKTEEIAGEPSFKEKIIKLNEEMGNDGNTNIVTLSLHREKDLIEAVEKLSKGVKGLKLEHLNDDTQILITDTLRDSILNIISEQMAKITAGQELTAAQEKALNEIFEETTSYLKGMKDCSVSELTDIIRNCYLKTENIAGNNPVLRIKALFKDETAFVLHSQQGFLISEKPYSDQDFFKQLDYYVSKLAENKKEFTILLDMHGGIRGEILASDDILSSIPKILKQIRANSGNAKVNIITDSCHGQAIGDFTSQVLDYGFNYLGISSVNNAVYMALNLDHFNNSIEQVFLNAISKGYLGAVLVYEGKVYRPLDYAKKYYTDYEYDPVMLKQIDLLDKMLFGKDPVEAMIELGKQEGYSLRLFNSRWALGKYAENVNNTLTPDEIARIIKRREFKYSLKNLFKKGKSTDYFSFVTNEIESQGSQFIIEFKDSKILALSGPTSKLKYSILKAMQEAFKKDGITISNPTEKMKGVKQKGLFDL